MQQNFDKTQVQKPRVFIPTFPKDERTIADFIMLSLNYTLVVGHTAFDIPAFSDNPEAFEEMVRNHSIIIENFLPIDAVTAKNFYWSSRDIETPACETFEAALEFLPNNEGIKAVAKIVTELGLGPDQWEKGPWLDFAPVSEKIIAELGIDPNSATRTAVLAAARAANKLELFSEYDRTAQVPALTSQHLCIGFADVDGSVTKL